MRPLADDEFAVRFREHELQGLIAQEVRIREGSVGLLFLDSKLERQQLPPGKHKLSSFWEGLLLTGPRKEVVLVRAAEIPLKFTLPELLTADPLFLKLDCTPLLKLQTGSEQLFYTNLMGERDRVTLLDLRSLVYSPLRDAVAGWFGQRSLDALVANPNLADLALTAEEAVRRALAGKGIGVVQVEPSSPSCAAWDEKTRKLAQALEEVWRAETDLERRRRFAQVKLAVDLQEIEEETAKLATFTKRADLWDRLRQAFNAADMSRIHSEEQLADFVRQADRDRLLKEDDFERLRRTLREKRDDEEKARGFLVRTTELERDFEYKMLELRKRKDLTTSEIEVQQGLERLRLQGEYDLERVRLDFQVERQHKEAESRLASEQATEAARRVGELEDAKTLAQEKGLERDSRRLDEELRLALKEREMAVQRADVAERQRLDLERQERQLDLDLKRRRAEMEMHLQRLQKEQELEMQRLTSLSQMPITTLVATADPGKAPLLADLAALKMKEGMTPEQIIALAADKNPQVLSYLEKARTAQPLSDEEKRLYERIITEQKDQASRMSQFYRDSQEMLLRVHNKSLDTIADIAKTLRRGGQTTDL